MPVGVIGLGKVGTGISKSLIESDFDVMGYDLSAAVRSNAAESGIQVAESNGDIARECETIILSLPHPDASRAAVDEIVESGNPGTDVFDTGTLSVTTARELHQKALTADIHYHDSPVTGGEVSAQRGELIMMIGGDANRIRNQENILRAIATEVYHIGEPGDGQFVKLIHNHVGQTTLFIFIEGCLLAEEVDVDPATLYRTLRYYTHIYDGKLDSFFSNEFDDEYDEYFAMEEGDMAQNRFNLNEAHKDLVELKTLANEHGSYLPLGNFVEQLHQEGLNAGYGDKPHPDLLQLYGDLFEKTIESTEEKRNRSAGQII
jgi:3-hydroxyisobutyrate dehydrogenase